MGCYQMSISTPIFLKFDLETVGHMSQNVWNWKYIVEIVIWDLVLGESS